ncbi:DNA topoisomerase 6 subunit b-like protein, partial [Trifolium pratense]
MFSPGLHMIESIGEITRLTRYKDKIGVFVSIVSTKIPFKGTGKEYIGDDITEIASAVKSSIQQCCVQLKSKIMKRMQAREQQQEREHILSRDISSASGLLYNALKDITLNPSRKSRYGADDLELLNKVADNLITKETFIEALTKHCEQ